MNPLKPKTPLPSVATENWDDWKWHMRNRIRNEADLCAYLDPTDQEKEAIEATKGVFQ